MKKTIYSILAAVLLTANLVAQPPEKMSYQSMVRNSSNQLVTNQTVGIQISILHGSASGLSVYSESHSPTTNANGMLSLEIGTGSVSVGNFSTIDWANGPFYLKTETDPTGGVAYSQTNTSELLSVPYALHAKTAGSINGGIVESDPVYSASEASKITVDDEAKLTSLSGANTGDQTVAEVATKGNSANVQIYGLLEPIDASDVATRAYVDALEPQLAKIQTMPGMKLIDIDGNSYETVQIGNQLWMAENLRTTKLNDGADIPLVNDDGWSHLSTQGYCWYNSSQSDYGYTYGALYNWYAVETGKLCPTGWHVPTHSEWITMHNYIVTHGYSYNGSLRSNYVAKSLASISNWLPSNITGSPGNTDYPEYRNKTGFNALPAGFRLESNHFFDNGRKSFMWSASAIDASRATLTNLSFNKTVLDFINASKIGICSQNHL